MTLFDAAYVQGSLNNRQIFSQVRETEINKTHRQKMDLTEILRITCQFWIAPYRPTVNNAYCYKTIDAIGTRSPSSLSSYFVCRRLTDIIGPLLQVFLSLSNSQGKITKLLATVSTFCFKIKGWISTEKKLFSYLYAMTCLRTKGPQRMKMTLDAYFYRTWIFLAEVNLVNNSYPNSHL